MYSSGASSWSLLSCKVCKVLLWSPKEYTQHHRRSPRQRLPSGVHTAPLPDVIPLLPGHLSGQLGIIALARPAARAGQLGIIALARPAASAGQLAILAEPGRPAVQKQGARARA